MESTSSKFAVKKNCEGHQPHRVLSVLNLTAAEFIPKSAKDQYSKFPVIKPKIARRKSEIIRRPNQEQPAWIVHYREHVEKQLKLNRHDLTNDLRQKKVTISFCEFLKKKEAELKRLDEMRQKKCIEVSPAKYQD
jgi:hypothetical protein